MRLALDLGAWRKKLLVLDRKAVIYRGRYDDATLNRKKREFACEPSERRTWPGALAGRCRRVHWLSGPDLVLDIRPEMALNVRRDLLMATGRSDDPNQVNNVFCFPFLFRGALNVRARTTNREMKIATVHALAELTPRKVLVAYGLKSRSFGPEYIIPKPLDPVCATLSRRLWPMQRSPAALPGDRLRYRQNFTLLDRESRSS